jgi:rhodanese-related sulfurtransferase
MNTAMLLPIDPQTLKRRLDEGSVILIDIREASEHARERIPGSKLAPLSTLDRRDFREELASGKTIVFHCKSGNRTAANAGRLVAKGCEGAFMLMGGLDGWKAAGLPTLVDRSAPIELQRQVQIAAGSLVVLGVALSVWVSPWFMLLSGFVGAGLIFAGVTGTCGMARFLSCMPWNRRVAAPSV